MKKLFVVFMIAIAIACVVTSCDKLPVINQNHVENTDTVTGEGVTKPEGNSTGTKLEDQSELVHDHTFGEWKTVKEATCAEEGEKARFCECGEKETETIEKTNDHTFGEWKTVKEATCAEEGEKARFCECGEKETAPIAVDASHSSISERIEATNIEDSYSSLFEIYTLALSHMEKCKCNLDISKLLKAMLYGEWEDAEGNYITYTFIYEDYYNTDGSTWYGTNLPNSKKTGNTYYYYIETKNNALVIGYQDKITEDKTDNFVISFEENGISVQNKIDGKTYALSLNANYDKVQKGNAKLAYVCIAKQVFNFKNPSSVKITQCYVNYSSKIVYATIQATNSYGGTVTEQYALYESDGQYNIVKYSNSYSSNIDLKELNNKLQQYVATGG